MAMSENGKIVLKHLQENIGTDETAVMIAEKLGMPACTVNGVITMALQRPGLVERVEVEGMDKKVIRLTPAGKAFNPDEE
jgi:hypothetical protein